MNEAFDVTSVYYNYSKIIEMVVPFFTAVFTIYIYIYFMYITKLADTFVVLPNPTLKINQQHCGAVMQPYFKTGAG